MTRPDDVAAMAGVPLPDVRQVSLDQVRAALVDRVPATVLEVLAQEPATFWQAGGRWWFDDPSFGDVCAVEDLRYNEDLGLHHSSMRDE